MRLIYLAGPYSNPDPLVRQERVRKHYEALAYYAHAANNLCLYSPIVHWEGVRSHHELPREFNFWLEQDFFMIRQSSAMWVLTIPGWQESFGVSQELEFAHDIGKDVFFLVKESGEFVLTDARPD